MPNVKFVSSLSEDLIRECMASGMTYICDAHAQRKPAARHVRLKKTF